MGGNMLVCVAISLLVELVCDLLDKVLFRKCVCGCFCTVVAATAVNCLAQMGDQPIAVPATASQKIASKLPSLPGTETKQTRQSKPTEPSVLLQVTGEQIEAKNLTLYSEFAAASTYKFNLKPAA